MKEYKHDNGFKLNDADHISGVQLANISTDFSYIKEFCVPETRQSADHYVFIITSQLSYFKIQVVVK